MKRIDAATNLSTQRWPSVWSTKTVWIILYIAYNVLDILTTRVGIAGGIPEGNPLPAWVLARWGEVAMYGLKVAVMGLALWIVLTYCDRRPRLWGIIYALVAVLAVVVTNNVRLISA